MLAADQDGLLISLFGRCCTAETTIILTGRYFETGYKKNKKTIGAEVFFFFFPAVASRALNRGINGIYISQHRC